MNKIPSFKSKLYPGLVFLVLLLSWSPVNVHVSSSSGISNASGTAIAPDYENTPIERNAGSANSVLGKGSQQAQTTRQVKPHYPILFH